MEFTHHTVTTLDKFNVDVEISIPTWYGQSLLLLAGLIAGSITHWAWQAGEPYRKHWAGITGLLVYMSVDEGTEIHELLIEPTQNALGINSGPLFFAWFIPVGIALLVLAIIYARFWWRLPQSVRTWLAVAAVVFITGSIGVEMISGNYWQANEFANNYTYRVFNAIEEGLEFVGVSLAIYALLLFPRSRN